MLSAHVKEMISKIQTHLASQPVNKAWIFGSCSRGEETADSDVDILVQYAGMNRYTVHHIPYYVFAE